MIRFLLCFALVLVLGCKGRDEPAAPSNVVEVLPADSKEAPALDTEEPTDQPSATEPVSAVEDVEELDEAGPAEVAEAEPIRPARDLAAELSAAVGSPAECLRDYRPSTAMTIRIHINAVVRPTGMVIEPSATGRGLSANDRRCMEQRVGEVMLAPLGGEASEAVSTHVDIAYEPTTTQVEKDVVGEPAPELENVVEPLPKKEPIEPSGVPIEAPAAEPIEGPSGVPIEGPKGVPIEGPQPKPIDGY